MSQFHDMAQVVCDEGRRATTTSCRECFCPLCRATFCQSASDCLGSRHYAAWRCCVASGNPSIRTKNDSCLCSCTKNCLPFHHPLVGNEPYLVLILRWSAEYEFQEDYLARIADVILTKYDLSSLICYYNIFYFCCQLFLTVDLALISKHK